MVKGAVVALMLVTLALIAGCGSAGHGDETAYLNSVRPTWPGWDDKTLLKVGHDDCKSFRSGSYVGAIKDGGGDVRPPAQQHEIVLAVTYLCPDQKGKLNTELNLNPDAR